MPVVFAPAHRLPLLALAGAALLLLGCQGAPGPMESSGSSQTSEPARGTPGAGSESDDDGSGAASAGVVTRDHGAGTGADSATRCCSDNGSDSGSAD